MKPVRVALFAPGINEQGDGQGAQSGVDAVILDLEDSVPIASKAEAARWSPTPSTARRRQFAVR